MKRKPSRLSPAFDALFHQSIVRQKTRSSGWVKSSSLSLLLVILAASFLVMNNSVVQWAATADSTVTDDWTMFRHDSQHSGYSMSTAPNTNQTLWSYATSGSIKYINGGYEWSPLMWSSPAVAGGKVYVGAWDNNVYCLDAATGALIWSYATGGGIRSSPAVVDGKVYVGSYDNNVYCLDATTGELKWNYTTGNAVGSSPAVADGKVYIGSDDGKVYCLNTTTGALMWSYITGGGVRSSPAVSDGKVYVGSYDNKIYCLNAADGSHVWNYTRGNGYMPESSPAVADGKVYVGSGSGDNKIYCLSATTGESIWNYTAGNGVGSSPAVAYGRVYVGSWDTKVYCLDAATGAFIWSYAAIPGVYSSPAVADGKVYVGAHDNNVHCLDAATGEPIWSYATDAIVSNYTVFSYVHSSPAVADGKVYVGSDNGKVYCFGSESPSTPAPSPSPPLPPALYISDFDDLFTHNSVRVIYPSEQTPKPLNCASAIGNYWAASALIYTKLETAIEGPDTDSTFVNQTTGKPLGAAGTGIVSFGSPLVNSVVAYAESKATPTEDRAPVRFYQNEEACGFQLRNGTSVPGAALSSSSINGNVDMFVIEVYRDGDGRNVMLGYGFGWKGTYAAGKYFDSEIYPNLTAYPYSWIIVLWHDSNGNGFVNTAADGDTYTVIATDQYYGMQADDTEWSYRKSHIINSAVGAGTDYQVKIVVHYGSGTDSGENVFLNSNCRSDFGDVRFTSDDGATPLDYWMESKAHYDKAVFWVKVSGDLSSADQTIHVYYGNSNAMSTSNGADTFLFFDNFSGDLSKWTQRKGNWTIDSSNYLKTPMTDEDQIATALFTMQNGRIRYYFKQDSPITGVNLASLGCMARSPSASTRYLFQCADQAVRDTCEIWKWVDGVKTGLNHTVVNAGADWHTGEFSIYGSELKSYLDDSNEVKVTDTALTESSFLGFRYGGMEGKYFLIDWIIVGKYVSPEPAHSAWGGEEPVAVTGL